MKTLPFEEAIKCKNKNHFNSKQTISHYLEISDDDNDLYSRYLVPDKVLERRIKVFDIVTKYDDRSLCFTKAYSHYAEGTGSIYCPFDRDTINRIYERSKQFLDEPEEHLVVLKKLKLRYFSPREVANLMCFPNEFSLPKSVTDRQGYRLLGNSINIHVVGALITLMVQEPNNT